MMPTIFGVSSAISKTFEIHTAHRLPNHRGKCKRLHGHTYRVDLMISGSIQGSSPDAPDRAMVLDFDTVKEIWSEEDVKLDHHTILWEDDPLVQDLKIALSVKTGKQIEELGDRWDTYLAEQGIQIVGEPPTAEYIAAILLHRMHDKFEEAGVNLDAVRVWETPTSWAIAQISQRMTIPIHVVVAAEDDVSNEPVAKVH